MGEVDGRSNDNNNGCSKSECSECFVAEPGITFLKEPVGGMMGHIHRTMVSNVSLRSRTNPQRRIS